MRVIGRRAVRLYPIFHPAAALYTPRMLEVLREDFARLPELLALPAPPQPEILAEPVVPIEPEEAPRAVPAPEPPALLELEPSAEPEPPLELPAPDGEPDRPGPEQLGLF